MYTRPWMCYVLNVLNAHASLFYQLYLQNLSFCLTWAFSLLEFFRSLTFASNCLYSHWRVVSWCILWISLIHVFLLESREPFTIILLGFWDFTYKKSLLLYLSYPAIVVIPCRVTDDSLMKVAKNHRLNRFPSAIWRHRRTKGTLLRSGTINRSVLTAVLRSGLGGRQTQGNHSANITDDEQFFSEIGKFLFIILCFGKE